MIRPNVALMLACASALSLAQGPAPVNLDFKASAPGASPAGWMVPAASKGFPAQVTDLCSKPGNRRCAVLYSQKAESSAGFGNLMQVVKATDYGGRQVTYKASVRVEAGSSGRAALWLRVDRPNQQMGFFDNMGDRPIVSANWATYEIKGEVAPDAEGIAFGVMLIGGEGKVYVDDVSFEATGAVEYAPVVERSRPLDSRGLENVVAFARLYGYVRHFYPGDEAAAADWEAIAVQGVREAEKAATPAGLARLLEERFRDVAPLVRVLPAAEPAPKIDYGTGAETIHWVHHGYGTGQPNNRYQSERVREKAPATMPEPFSADIGAGLRAYVPLVVRTDLKSIWPRGQAPARESAVRYRAEDRSVRLAGVIIAWNIFEHFYPYFDVVQTDWPGELTAALKRAAAGDEQDYTVTLRLLVAALKDGHGGVSPGLGGAPPPVSWDWIEDRLVVTYVPDAQGQAITAGDAVLAIDGKPVAQALAEAEALRSGATPQWIRYRAIYDLGAGPAGKPLTLEIEPLGAKAVRRTVSLKRTGSPPVEPRPEKIQELEPGIFYVDLTRITDADWKASVETLAKAKGIVFDLRGYPSLGPRWLTHLSPLPLTSAQWHVPLVTEPDRRNMKFTRSGEWRLVPSPPYLAAKKAVLTNASAISYAESTMGIIENYKLAEIVGGATAGTNGNINPIRIPGGYTIIWTGMKVLKHDGSQHHGVGIRPTIPAVRTRAGVAAGVDEVLERGIRAVE